MTQFDYAILLVFLVSGFMGFLRGASREVVTVLALTFGAMGALFGLPFVGPLARKLVNPDWLGTVGAGIVLFLSSTRRCAWSAAWRSSGSSAPRCSASWIAASASHSGWSGRSCSSAP
jgi:hypothetical protein